ncbi:sensor domain-containing diguanylate cyclase [Vreelandella gomseomensis]|uniref:diguanylate cyclase n=1 Tax=Vreelandella gomseomensis TaxID=370766 RepID=A0ABU1GDM5_9GAMM|nr:sensor domain-containing diguanylate cyclase [Halomonas gomseomensis]MDR5875397.1 sensor domain-containing diguanylate cyclase [Halomonas gomseomensis]
MSGLSSTPVNSFDCLCHALGLISRSETPAVLFERLSSTLHTLVGRQPIALYRRSPSGELRLTYCHPVDSAITACRQLMGVRSLDELRAFEYQYYALPGEHGAWGYIGHPSAPPKEALHWISIVVDIAAQRLRLLKADHMARRQIDLKARRRQLSRDIKRLTSLADCLQHHGQGWCDIFQADGIALAHKDELYCVGKTPDRRCIFQHLGHLDAQADLDDSPIELEGECQGGIATPLSMAGSQLGWLLMFRAPSTVSFAARAAPDIPLSVWLPVEASMVLELADDLAVAITALEVVHVNRQLRKTNQRLESLAHTDPLTRCWNRYYTEHVIEALCASSPPCAVSMFDIDDFKGINDTYGHAVGDDILREVANLATQLLRSNDYLGRWGGEEFIVILADTAQDEGAFIAQRLCRYIEQHPFSIPETVTISAGLTTVQPGEPSHSLLERVDKGMYLAKAAGKNQVMIC